MIWKKLACVCLFMAVLMLMMPSCGGGSGGGAFNFTDPNAPTTFFEVEVLPLGPGPFTGNIIINIILRNPFPSSVGSLTMAHSINGGPFFLFNSPSNLINLFADEQGVGYQLIYPSRDLGVALDSIDFFQVQVASNFSSATSDNSQVDNDFKILIFNADDTPTDSILNVSEAGQTDTFKVKLNRQPTANVAVELSHGAQVTLDAAVLAFTTNDWNVLQPVVVTAVDDAFVEGDHTDSVIFSSTSADDRFNDLDATPEVINIEDNNIVVIVQSGGTTVVSETFNGVPPPDTYTIVLEAQPTADVVFQLNFDPVQIAVETNGTSKTSGQDALTFTSGNFSTPQTVTVVAFDDIICEQPQHSSPLGHTTTSGDPQYNGLLNIPDVSVLINDNEFVTVSGLPVNVNEQQPSSDTFVLTACQTPNIGQTVTVAVNNPGNEVNLVLSNTFFDPATLLPITVTVTAIDDPDVEGLHETEVTFVFTSTDQRFNGLDNVPPVTVTITDND